MKVINSSDIIALRKITGAGFSHCKEALINANGNIKLATKLLENIALNIADKKLDRPTNCGIIYCYIHPGSQMGILIELNCESESVSKREEFHNLAKDICLQIAMFPDTKYISNDDAKADSFNKNIIPLEQCTENSILLFQKYIKDTNLTVEKHIKKNIALLGENIKIRRFQKYILNEK